MNKRERVLQVLSGKAADRVPASFWFHFSGEESQGEACVKAHLDYYRANDLDFIKIMSDGLNYPIRVRINSAEDWFKLEPLPENDPFFTDSVERCRRINQELDGECCTFFNVFSPFNIVRERDVFTPEALQGRSWDATVMAHLQENEAALAHAMSVIGDDLAKLAIAVIKQGGCEGIYQSVQGAERGRMDAETYARVISPHELKILQAANSASSNNMLHMCSWAGNPNHLSYWKDYPTRVKNWGAGVEGVSLRDGLTMFPGSVLMGGLDNRKDHPLYKGPKEAIVAAVKAVLEEMSGVPFILGADCTVPADINQQHIKYVMETLKE